ncbi:Zinc finger protein ZAT5 [Camellia lanceoleosa]|uniref:Zinc finger protein ZAT5 n=1 Tax=Camellia lanceoleosa TaxID=1840588 RepID=A0ACC0FW98_9ERIC|nr:Zinc finger protein ZAT5 [Camellia lanceoleosa]
MDMESPEEFTDSNDHTVILRRKRTKRQRPPSPSPPAPTTSTSSSGGGGGGGGDFYSSSIPSPTASSGEISTSVDEDEDMANCLILLAQGVGPTGPTTLEEEGTTTIGKVRFYVYQCKTCNRTFPSFQALGGHRASHKKPKVEEKRIILVTPPSPEEEKEEEARFNKFSPPPPLLQTATKSSFISNKLKVHECSVCGSEFSSGQALGGHMRRHRAPPNTRIAMIADTSPIESQKESDKPRKILSLDLNLPAPLEDDDDGHDHIDSRFQFTPNKQGLVFSGPALVDCHY